MKTFLKKIFAFILIVFLALFLPLVYKAYVLNKPCQHKLKKIDAANKIIIKEQNIGRLQKSLSFETTSYEKDKQNTADLAKFIIFIREEFSELESLKFVRLNVINKYSLLYQITGKNPELKPYLLAAHSDIVPANAQSDNSWSFNPYAGNISEGYIYGRGTLDDKSSILGQLEAVSQYIRRNGQPTRSIFLAYGHDEETGGCHGAMKILEFLNSTELEFVLDEGMMIIEDLMKGFERPVALIAIAEKGYMSVKFHVSTTGGHSAVPNDDQSPIFILAEAINRIKQNKPQSFLGYGPEKYLFDGLAAHLGFIQRVMLSNLWFFKPILERFFQNTNLDTLQRTSTSITLFKAGVKENVVPAYAEFVVNHRIHSLQTCQDVLDHDLRVIGDERIKYEVLDCVQPSSVSPVDSLGFEIVKHSTLQVYPEVMVVPGLMIGVTDSRYYSKLSQSVYKFLPVKICQADVKRYHGVDERISLQNYENMINFYYVLIENSDKAHLEHDFFKSEL